MLNLLSGPFEAAGRLPQLKIKRWAVGTIKLSFRKLNSNLREQVGRAAGAVIGALQRAEMFIGSQDGLGHSVFEAQQLFEMPRMYAAIFAAGALGYGLNLLFLLVERRFVHWTGK
jgi:hypothetical protein